MRAAVRLTDLAVALRERLLGDRYDQRHLILKRCFKPTKTLFLLHTLPKARGVFCMDYILRVH